MPFTLLEHLLRIYPRAKRTTLRRMVQAGRVRVNGRMARSVKEPVGDKDVVRVDDSRAKPQAARAPLPIVFEDEDILVIDKPAGLLTSTVPREKRPTVLAMLREYMEQREPRAKIGLIHRLDADASGLLIFSKNQEAFASLKRQFLRHSVERIYLAVVGHPPTPAKGTIDTRLVERADGSVYSTKEHARGQRAITYYETLGGSDEKVLLRMKLQTGRKHQIRAQLAERGSPIINDPIYGSAKPEGRLMLAAIELSIDHPQTGRRMKFLIDTPSEMTV